MIIRELSAAECTDLISRNRFGRLAAALDNRPYLVPIFYAYRDGHAYAFTKLGRKLETMRANPLVALLVEETGEDREWTSVIAEGVFEELPDRIGYKHERDRAWSLLSVHADWWEPGSLKPVAPPLSPLSQHVFFRIRIERMSGRKAVEV